MRPRVSKPLEHGAVPQAISVGDKFLPVVPGEVRDEAVAVGGVREDLC